MTYVVNDNCIRCKTMDCVEVCPVDCFYEGENMLVIRAWAKNIEFVGLSIPLLPISWRRLFGHNIRPDFSRILHSATAISQAQVRYQP